MLQDKKKIKVVSVRKTLPPENVVKTRIPGGRPIITTPPEKFIGDLVSVFDRNTQHDFMAKIMSEPKAIEHELFTFESSFQKVKTIEIVPMFWNPNVWGTKNKKTRGRWEMLEKKTKTF